jgi:SAM-dependent MidA family methyltransferase
MNTSDPTSQPGSSAAPFSRRLRQGQAQLADWPEPDQEACRHSLQLIEQINAQIAVTGGCLTFHDYMQAVLYTPGLGYYTAGASKFGAGGDFVTAPELSPLFAECIAGALSPVLAAHSDYAVLEAGAGSGQLAAQLLGTWQQQDRVPLHYYILELSADLRERQRRTIAQHCPEILPRVKWLDTWPGNFTGIVIANELLDAMPVHLVHKQRGQWQEQCVRTKDDRFVWDASPIDNPALRQRLIEIEQQQPLPDDYVTEVNLNAEHWIGTLGQHLQQGLVLLLDYGYPRHEYYHPQRERGTLMCHYRHRAHDDPFIYPGLQDITAHVDFTAMADAALAAGFAVAGYTTQAHFLLEAGIMQHLEARQQTDEMTYLQHVNEVKRLTLPQEMGEVFKVMLLDKQAGDLPAGFTSRDLRHQL